VIPERLPAIKESMQTIASLTAPFVDTSPATEAAQRFEVLYRAHYSHIAAYASRRLPARADDVVAETFLVAWRRFEHLPDDALPWLYGVARRVISDMRRSTRRQGAVAVRLAEQPAQGSSPPLADSDLERALAALPERDRELLLLVYWEDLEPARAAIVVGCSRAAAATRLWRARRRLKAHLDRTRGGKG
jgi:RNA polymerase sigma-70 factor (ECF subfamily)